MGTFARVFSTMTYNDNLKNIFHSKKFSEVELFFY